MRTVSNGFAVCAVAMVLSAASPASAMTVDQAANDTRAFIEWAFGFKLDPVLVQAIRQGTASDMSSNPNGTAATVKDMNQTMSWVQANPSGSDMLRSLIEPQLIVAWQNDTSDAVSQALVAAWKQHKHILAQGTPPLRESVVNAYIAMFEFLCKQTGKQVPAQVANHEQFKAHVASLYSSASPQDQMNFNQVQTLWFSLQTVWRSMTPAQQAAFRQQLRNPSATAARIPRPTAPPSSGYSGQTWSLSHWEEHNFVEQQSESIMSSWSNPFG